ncbi:uncharacterized protein LOC116898118 [Rattus rattus]|uniref:uncharacterized protein LOC116898118 n=1 Tax=Rattus rattus TaxID=10117 RepID=UPI0013F315C5|nr:uncharacterized protein LOC116898118 [Rattus rattus]
MNSISDFWMSSSSMSTAMDMIFAIACGVGFFFLLIPFLKEYPGSPPPGSEKNISEVVKRRQSKDRKKSVTVEGCRDSQKNSLDIQHALQTMESPIQHLLLDSSPHLFWNSKEKLNQLSLPQLFSYLKVLEALIQQKFNQLLLGLSSVLSESVVATAWISREPSSGERKTVRFSDSLGFDQALPLAKGPPQRCQDQPLPHQLVTPSLVGMTEIQEQENLPNSISYQTPSTFQSRACGTAYPTTATGIQVPLPTTNEPCHPGLNWKDIPGCKVQNCQGAISQPIESLARCTLPTKNTRSAFILPEHYLMVHHHEQPQHEEKAINLGEQQRTHARFLPSKEPAQLQGDSPPNSNGYGKNWPELNQPAQPSTLNSKTYKWNQMMGPVPSGMLLKKVIAKYGIPNTIKKDLKLRVKDLLCTSSSTPGESLETKNLTLRTDEHSMNITENLSFLDPKTTMMKSNIMQLPMKHRQLPCDSKAEPYTKAAFILENLHHQDPGGIRVETASSARLRSPLFEQSPPEVQKTQSSPPPIDSHGHSRSHPDQWQRYQSVQPHALCSQAQPQQSRTIQGTGRYILQPNTSVWMSKHERWIRSEDVASGHPSWGSTTVGCRDRVSPSVAKQTNVLKIKEESPHAWRANLGSGEITNGQALNKSNEDFEPIEAKRSQGHLQMPTQQNTGYLHLKTEEYSNNDLKVNKQPQAWSVSHHAGGSNTVHPAMVRLPSHSLPSLQSGSQDPKTSQGLGDLLMNRDQSVETQFRVHKDKTEPTKDSVFHPSEKRPSNLKYGGISQGERLGRVKSSISSFTQLKDSAKTESKSSPNIGGKREVPSKSSLKFIWNAAQYENLSTKLKGQRDSLKKEIPPPATEQTQEVVHRINVIYSTAVELQSLMDSLVHKLVKTVGEPSELTKKHMTKVQEYKMESLPFQLGSFSHSSKGLHDPNKSRSVRRMNNDHTSPKEHNNHTFIYRGNRDKMQAGMDVQRVCYQHRDKVKIGFGQHSTPMRNDNPCFHKKAGDKQESSLADQSTGDADQTKPKNEIGGSPHRIPERHNQSSRYREIRDNQEPGVDHKAIDPHQNTKKGMGYSQLMSPKENHPVKISGTAAQGASDPEEIRTKSGKECSPHRSPKMHDHSLRHREVRDKPQPGINTQRAYDQHLNSPKKRMTSENFLTPKGTNHPCWHRVTGDKQHSSLSNQRACDPEQIRRSGMSSYPQRSPKVYHLSFSSREIGEKLLPLVNAQRTHDKHPNSVKTRVYDNLPTPKGSNHPQGYRVIEDKQQLGLAYRRTCDPGQIKKSGMGKGPCKDTEESNLLYRYKIIGNKQQPGIVHRACDRHQSTKEGMGHGQPMNPKVSHSAKHRRTGGQDQSGVAAQGASNPR